MLSNCAVGITSSIFYWYLKVHRVSFLPVHICLRNSSKCCITWKIFSGFSYPLWRCYRCGCWSDRAGLWAGSDGNVSVWRSGCLHLQLYLCCPSEWICLESDKSIIIEGPRSKHMHIKKTRWLYLKTDLDIRCHLWVTTFCLLWSTRSNVEWWQ